METRAYEEMARDEATHWWFVGRRLICEQEIKRLALVDSARILEVGCGTGGNLEMLSRWGSVTAFEPDTAARKMATHQSQLLCGRIAVLAGSCPDHVPDVGHFDLICLFDVLEHIRDDVGTLVALRRLLRPGGRVLLTVPAYPILWGPHDRFLHHQRRYARKTLRSTAALAGFAITRISSFNILLLPALAGVRLLETCLRVQSSAGRGIPPRWINRMLQGVFCSERYLLRHVRLPAGLSLLAVLEPN